MVLFLIKHMFLYQETTWYCDLIVHWSRGIIYLFWVTFIYLPIYSCVVVIIPTRVFLCESCYPYWNTALIVPSENNHLKTLLFTLSEWCMTLTCNVFWDSPQLLICEIIDGKFILPFLLFLYWVLTTKRCVVWVLPWFFTFFVHSPW